MLYPIFFKSPIFCQKNEIFVLQKLQNYTFKTLWFSQPFFVQFPLTFFSVLRLTTSFLSFSIYPFSKSILPFKKTFRIEWLSLYPCIHSQVSFPILNKDNVEVGGHILVYSGNCSRQPKGDHHRWGLVTLVHNCHSMSAGKQRRNSPSRELRWGENDTEEVLHESCASG